MASQRGQMIPRGQNKWLLRIYLGSDAEGKRRYSAKAFAGTTSQARQALTAMLRGVDTHSFVPSSKVSLGEYLAGWLAGKLDISEKSRRGYRDMMKHFEPIWHLRLTDLEAPPIQECVRVMVDKGRSPRTIQYAVRILDSALGDAVRAGTLTRSPAKYITRPKAIKRGASVLSVEQVNLFLEKTSGDRLHALWMLLLTTGMRPGEAFGLKWEDIDFDGRWLSIRRRLVSDGYGHTTLTEGAKAGSERRIGLASSMIEELKLHRRHQAEAMLNMGQSYQRNGLVFANRRGGALSISKVRVQWKAALEKANLPSIRLYDARHTHLTALLAHGADIAWVAARAGHKSIAMTRDHYAHVLPETHRAMGEMTERLLQTR